MKNDVRELTAKDFERAIPRQLRDRLVRGDFRSGEDVAALRRFTGLSQDAFARALGINVHTLRNWEQGRRMPAGPALALLRIAARHPKVLRENLALAG
jgi:DNA-binding transcriptional regulator YiaG